MTKIHAQSVQGMVDAAGGVVLTGGGVALTSVQLAKFVALVAEYATEPLVTCGGGPPGDPNGEQQAARVLELEQNEARLETFIMQQDMRVGDLQKAVQRLKDLNNELFVSRCEAHMRTEQLEDFLRRMLEAATPQIGHAWKEEIRQVLVEAAPDSKTPNAAITGAGTASGA